jgi:RHS repeat-associated protein
VKTYSYAADDKLTGISYSNEVVSTPDVTFSYGTGTTPDPYGRLITMVDGTGTTSHAYHAIGTPGALQVASIDGPIAGSGDLLEYDYDVLVRVNSRTLNGTANAVSSRFDSVGRLRTLVANPGTFTFEYEGVTGRPQSLTYPNGQQTAYAYYANSGDHRLQQIHNRVTASGATLSKFDYTYHAVGTIDTWSKQVATNSPTAYHFEYDDADQLTVATPSPSGPPLLEEGYDNAGNRTAHSVDSDGGSASYTERNEITASSSASGPTTYTHDFNGNLTSDGVKTYVWDAEDRLVAVQQGGSPIAAFAYDGQGRRRQKSAGGVTRSYLYDGARIIEERLSSGPSVLYVDGPGIDQHLATQERGGATRYFTSDHLGSIAAVTDGTGAVVLARAYDPWGNLSSGASASGYAFTGREWDAESGLYYYRARYYDPKIGRFISEDPIGLRGGLNRYRYVNNRPTRFTDPLGLCPPNPCYITKTNCPQNSCTCTICEFRSRSCPTDDPTLKRVYCVLVVRRGCAGPLGPVPGPDEPPLPDVTEAEPPECEPDGVYEFGDSDVDVVTDTDEVVSPGRFR